jgi:DoxX
VTTQSKLDSAAAPSLVMRARDLHDPAYQALLMLRTVFTVAPIAFGLDKFFNILTDWPQYLSGRFDSLIPGNAHQAMLMVGIVEIAAGVLVALWPHIGGYVVAAWLAGIILNLLLVPGYYDVALRDFGLLVAALALARLARAFRAPAARAAAAGRS